MTAPSLGELLPLWSAAPFSILLLAVALLPVLVPHWWHHNTNKALVSAILGLPVAGWIGWLDGALVLHTAHEYIAFVILLATLYVVSGGIVVRGALAGTPGLNTTLLALGTVLASLIGTTGASMLLIRPVLRANKLRQRRVHVVVFFIFLVSNIGGLLTPLGDPPLFLGFLRGVPFFWTLSLIPHWAVTSGFLLLLFFVIDSTIFRREDLATPGDLDEQVVARAEPVRVDGKLGFLWLGAVLIVIVACGNLGPPPGVQEAGMLACLAGAWLTTPASLRRDNDFTWGPMIEVAVVFAGIFAAMIPALALLQHRGAELGLEHPWQFFWATGILSSFLDNAPTYLTFASTASGLLGTSAQDLSQLIATARGPSILAAISLGAVLMGANTYIGNGPNFMVRAVAEADGVKMPSFLGYMAWSFGILLPIFALLTALFL
jgi:Na+/H+ antiporter NhaD/arsenite permease-like protein